MALQTKTFTAGGTADTRYYSIQLKLTEESVSVSGNTSVVAYEFSIHRQNSGVYTGPYYSWTITIGGKSIAINNFAFNIPTSGAASQVIASGRLTIPHDADGGKDMKFHVYTPSAQDVSPTYGPPEIRLTGTWVLTNIPRASSVSAINADIGSTTIITISRASSAFTHTVIYKFGDLSGTIATKTAATSIPWTVPKSFYEEIPNAKSGTVTLTCQTYSGNTLIGTKTATFRATASEEACKPGVSGTAVVTDELSKSLTGGDNRVIRYVSTVKASITASPKNGATIAGRTVNGKALTDTMDFSKVETGAFVFATTDSRGYTGSNTKTLDMVSYIPLTLTALVSRKTPTGDIVVLDIKGNFWEGNFGAADNALTISYQYRTGSGAWSDPVPVTGAGIAQNTYKVSAEVSGMDYREGDVFRLTAGDCAMEVTREVSISAGVPVFDWGKEDFAFHVPVTFPGGEMADHVIATGATNNWRWRKWKSGMAECWQRLWVNTDAFVLENGIYRADVPESRLNLPFPFTDTPKVLVNVDSFGFEVWLATWATGGVADASHTGAYTLLRNKGAGEGKSVLNYYVQGFYT